MIDVTFHCMGCDESITLLNCIHRKFTSLTGKSYGIGFRATTQIDEIEPEGWVAFDPYTQATYCPRCWDEIENGEVDIDE